MHEKSVKLLNDAIMDEMSAVHQYMYFHFRLDDLGYDPLANLLKRIAIEEMGHVETLAERVLFLGGEVELKVKEPVEKIHDAKAMLQKAMAMEKESTIDYNKMAMSCAQNADSASKKIFEALVDDEERHFDIFEKQADNIERFGEQYLALQSFREDPMGPSAG